MFAPAGFLIAWAGIVAGCHHAVTGPDHLAAVAPFAVTQGRRAWRVGIAWGFGHAIGAASGALLALSLRSLVPGLEERLSAVSETLVGVLLCIVGMVGLHAWIRARHAHVHESTDATRPRRGSVLAFGFLHGVAGLSHLFAIVPALALPGIALPLVYLGGYAFGSLVLMAGFAAALGRVAPPHRRARARTLLACSSAASLIVGVVWIVHPL